MGDSMEFMGQLHEQHKSMELDLTDRKILYLLSQNARFSESSIAKALGISKEVVHYRIKGLQREGFLHGFITLLDMEKLGQSMYSVTMVLHPSYEQQEMLGSLIADRRVSHIKHLSSLLNLQFAMTTATGREFTDFFDAFLHKYHAGIKDYELSVILEQHFMGLDFLLEGLDEKEKPKISEHKGSSFQNLFLRPGNRGSRPRRKAAGVNQVVTDAKDREILRCLKLNSRLPMVRLAREVKLNVASVQKRLAHLVEKGVITHFVPYASFSYLGYQWFELYLRTKHLNEHSFRQYLHQEPKIVWLSKRLGKWNYHLSIFARNNTEFNQVVQKLQQQFQDSIIAYDTSTVLKQYKFAPRVE